MSHTVKGSGQCGFVPVQITEKMMLAQCIAVALYLLLERHIRPQPAMYLQAVGMRYIAGECTTQ
jgi:hypothetical protein